jgi:16S rRNA A1518/A1519 N6-dimethyltransferase RsmA/KsgA/DIM1 with predicted DNA glycosylase/AP lyase activity
MTRVDYWNHNVHYQPVILNAVPDGCGAALEVGCGDGLLARRLAARAAEVTAIDCDAGMVALARQRTAAPHVRFVHADFLACPMRRPASTSPAPTPRCITWTSRPP